MCSPARARACVRLTLLMKHPLPLSLPPPLSSYIGGCALQRPQKAPLILVCADLRRVPDNPVGPSVDWIFLLTHTKQKWGDSHSVRGFLIHSAQVSRFSTISFLHSADIHISTEAAPLGVCRLKVIADGVQMIENDGETSGSAQR